MRCLLRHLPLVMLTALMLMGTNACGNDEPRGKHHSGHDEPTPTDTTHHSGNDTTATDTTHHNDGDTTVANTISIHAARDYGYMGQTLQLTAVTSHPATVTWQSLNVAAATIDRDNGMVTFGNVITDATTLITATAAGVSDTMMLTNRCWHVAAWDGNAWTAPSYFVLHRGDTLVVTLADSQSRAIDDQGFNAASCQWTATSRNAATTIITAAASDAEPNAWQRHFFIAADAPAGATFTVTAVFGDAASTLSGTVVR